MWIKGECSLSELNLPDDLEKFLKQGKQLDYDINYCQPGKIKLFSFNELGLGEIYIDSEDSLISDQGDPNQGMQGFYQVPIVDLVAEAEFYSPEGLLFWQPGLGVYGSHDCDHADAVIFPGAGWTDIVNDPARFINAQWYPGKVNCENLVPWPRFSFQREQ